MNLPDIKLTVEERDLILASLGDNIPPNLYTKLTPYIKIRGHVYEDVFVLIWREPIKEDNILDWKVETRKVDYVDDYSPTNYECWIRRNYATPLKADVFTHRWEATLEGHKRHLKLLEMAIDTEKDDIDWAQQYKIIGDQNKYIKLIKVVKRKIHLIEDFPEKHI